MTARMARSRKYQNDMYTEDYGEKQPELSTIPNQYQSSVSCRSQGVVDKEVNVPQRSHSVRSHESDGSTMYPPRTLSMYSKTTGGGPVIEQNRYLNSQTDCRGTVDLS
jgi:hypothetical protein